jgi:hypothetical protein
MARAFAMPLVATSELPLRFHDWEFEEARKLRVTITPWCIFQ